MNVAAVPVKDLVNAKQRLVGALSASERMALARAMLHDVLRSLVAAPLDARWVVTRDAEVTATARAFGVDVVREDVNQGHTAAVAAAQAEATRLGARVFVTIPGDVPCVTAEEIRALVTRADDDGPAAVFAPSDSGHGTNAVQPCTCTYSSAWSSMSPPGCASAQSRRASLASASVRSRHPGRCHSRSASPRSRITCGRRGRAASWSTSWRCPVWASTSTARRI